jgi:ElaB/YqjD/DUF883 family membrane-anchored ribosome-binding protein
VIFMPEVETRRLMDDLRAVVHDAETLMSATADEAGVGVREARQRAAETLEQARLRLETLETEVRARAREAADDADTYVRQHPWQSVGVAAAVGFLIGLLVSRR